MAGSAIGLEFDLVDLAEPMPSIVEGPLSRVRAAENDDRLMAAVFVLLLNSPNVARSSTRSPRTKAAAISLKIAVTTASASRWVI
jgi:hypothetical protein